MDYDFLGADENAVKSGKRIGEECGLIPDSLPTDRDFLIDCYCFRFLPPVMAELSDPEDIALKEDITELLKRYFPKWKDGEYKMERGKAAAAKREFIDTVIHHAEDRAITFVCAERNRLRKRALRTMSEEELNERELKYLRLEGEFWYKDNK